MSKKNYRRREVLNDWKFGVKQKFNIKCNIDIAVFAITFVLFVAYSLKHGSNPYESVVYMGIMIALFTASHLITKQWIKRAIRKSIKFQSESVSKTTSEFVTHKVKSNDTLNSLSLKYYNNPTFWWVIAYFNDIQDPFKPLRDKYETLKIPSISSVEFGRINK